MPDRPAVPSASDGTPAPLASLLDIRPKDLTRAEKDALVVIEERAK